MKIFLKKLLVVCCGILLFSTFYFLNFSNIFAADPLDAARSFVGVEKPPLTQLSGTTTGSVEYLFLQLLKWLIAVFWILAVGFVIWAAFTFLFADGDEGKIGEAKNRLKYAVIAAAVALLSTGINVIVYYLLGGN